MKDFSIQLSKILWLVLVVAAPAVLFAQEPELITEIEVKQVYEGESFTYRVTLNHVDNPSPPDLQEFVDFQVEAIGEVDLNSRQMIIVNGIREDIVRRGRQYQYRLSPLKSGELTIPAPKATVDGKVLVGKALQINVIAADSQDFVRLKISIDRDKVYPTQPFTMTLQIAVKALPSPVSDTDPLSVQGEPPLLTVDWLDDNRLDKSIHPEVPWQEELQKLVSRRGHGLRINSIRSSTGFSFFDESLAFHPRPNVVQQSDKDGVEKDYWIYEFKRTFRARSAGVYKFSGATVKGTFATKYVRRELKGEAVFAKSDGVSVEVRDVPEQGRPESYIGAIGKFTLAGELSPTEARVGDPMTLTLSLNGNGTIADARPPDIGAVAELSNSFKVYEGTSQTKGNLKTFTYSLRPLDAAISELPSIPVSYFDADKETYVTLETQPIPLKLTASQQLATNEVIAANNDKDSDSEIGISESGLLANYSLRSLRDDSLEPKQWLIAWAGLLVGIVLLNLVSGLLKRAWTDPYKGRRRMALSRAQSAIAQASSSSSSGASSESVDQVRRAITGLVSDLLGSDSQGLTASEIRELLRERGVEPNLQEKVLKLLEQCDAAKFGAKLVSTDDLISQASAVAPQLHQQLTRNKKVQADLILLGLMLSYFGFLSGCSSSVNENVSRKFLEAEQSFEMAKADEDFQQVAQRYQEIIDSGFRCGSVYYNQGNAWAKANQPGRAIAAYRQALKYSPRDKNARSNLKITMDGIPDLKSKPNAGGVLRYLYFWRDWFSLRELFIIQTILFLALAITATCAWQLGKCGGLAVGLVVPTLAIGASCFFEWHEQLVVKRGVVIAGPVTALKGDSENYQPAFTGQLPTGTEFWINEQRREWLQIEVEGIGGGWVQESKVLQY